MNIAIFRDGPFLPPITGGAVSIYNLITELKRRGVNVYLIKCHRSYDNYQLYKQEKFLTFFVKEKNYYLDITPIINFLKRKKIQIAHFDSAEAVNWQGNLIKFRLPTIRIVWEVHNVNHILFLRLGKGHDKINLAIEQEKMAMNAADLILVRSKFDKKVLTAIGGNKNKIRIYKGGIKIGKQIKRVFPEGNKNIIFIGNLLYQPNREAIRIIDKIIAPRLPDYTFQTLGGGDKKLIKSVKSKNIKFLGIIENPYQFYTKAFIGIAPLLSGSGTRIKILEYLNSGLPTITTNIGIEGLEEEIRKVLIVEDNFKKYPIIIRDLAQNPRKWLNLSRRGQYFVKKIYNWSNNIKDIIRGYQSLLK
jgi:glycosyltransferase involved in cell wall biosynthesis